jgi:hypothetical protein
MAPVIDVLEDQKKIGFGLVEKKSEHSTLKTLLYVSPSLRPGLK